MASDPVTWVHNCLGGPSDNPDSPHSKDEAVESIFRFDSTKNLLTCAGNGAPAQAIVQNVAQFQYTYLEQITDASGSKVRYLPAGEVTNWRGETPDGTGQILAVGDAGIREQALVTLRRAAL